MITYRLATASDAAASRLTAPRRSWSTTASPPPSQTHLRATVAAILEAPEHLVLVAETEDRLAGMCALIFSQSTWSASPVCELQDVVVTRDYRRTDVGRGLIQAAEEIARARGCTRLFLLAEYWNLDAHAFYRSLGMAEKTCLYFERDLRTPYRARNGGTSSSSSSRLRGSTRGLRGVPLMASLGGCAGGCCGCAGPGGCSGGNSRPFCTGARCSPE